jgi:hypothetical protein
MRVWFVRFMNCKHWMVQEIMHAGVVRPFYELQALDGAGDYACGRGSSVLLCGFPLIPLISITESIHDWCVLLLT